LPACARRNAGGLFGFKISNSQLICHRPARTAIQVFQSQQ
jgi:hypothetical protein